MYNIVLILCLVYWTCARPTGTIPSNRLRCRCRIHYFHAGRSPARPIDPILNACAGITPSHPHHLRPCLWGRPYPHLQRAHHRKSPGDGYRYRYPGGGSRGRDAGKYPAGAPVVSADAEEVVWGMEIAKVVRTNRKCIYILYT